MMKHSLINLLKKHRILKHGNFTLRSGITSSYYCDIKEALGVPSILDLIIKEFLPIIPAKTTCIVGSGYGGITLASLVAYKKKLPLVLVRDYMKDHGTKKVIDGYVPTKRDTVCIIDDVFTTGSSIRDTKEKLSALHVNFTKSVVVLNRSNSKTILSILNNKDLA